ncbi:hypothetical protein ABFX02_10G101200 [Erythranthe guttata]
MEKMTSVLRLLFLLVCVAISRTDGDVLSSKKWCVARLNVSVPLLENYIKKTCNERSCTEIEPGGPCYITTSCCPKRRKVALRHASYLLNWDYKKITRVCDKTLGRITQFDPSYGEQKGKKEYCKYP